MFRGREVTHPERGMALLDRLAGELSEIAVVEQSPVQDGRNMTMMLAPSKAVLSGDGAKEKIEGNGDAARRCRRSPTARAADGNAGDAPPTAAERRGGRTAALRPPRRATRRPDARLLY